MSASILAKHLGRCIQITICPLTLFVSFTLLSCTTLLNNAIIEPTVGNLQRQSDVELVCDGASSYLLMIDSLIESNPDDNDLLLTGAKAYSGVISALASCGTDGPRLQTLSQKAHKYGIRLLQAELAFSLNDISSLESPLENSTPQSAENLFWGSYGVLSWIQQQNGSPESLTALIIVEKIMGRLTIMSPSIENGGPHLFFGALLGSKPPMLGGNLAQSKEHFETALEIADRSFLLTQLTYAETYCRMAFDRELHDSLLNEIISYPLENAPQNVLVNQIAKRKAARLLADGYFD